MLSAVDVPSCVSRFGRSADIAAFPRASLRRESKGYK